MVNQEHITHSTKLLHFFIIVGKLFLWDCRRNQTKLARKTYLTRRKTNKDYFEKKWILSPEQKSNQYVNGIK